MLSTNAIIVTLIVEGILYLIGYAHKALRSRVQPAKLNLE